MCYRLSQYGFVLVLLFAGMRSRAPAQEAALPCLPLTSNQTIRGSVFGVSAIFTISQYDDSTKRILGSVVLSNTTSQDIEFKTFAESIWHIRLEGADGKEVRRAKWAGPENPFAKRNLLSPGQQLTNTIQVNLERLFELERGQYCFFFVYDVRLMRLRQGNEWPYIPWSKHGIQFNVKQSTQRR